MKVLIRLAALWVTVNTWSFVSVNAFSPVALRKSSSSLGRHSTFQNEKEIGSSTALQQSSKNDDKNKLNEGLRTKLVTETMAPWRAVRLFFYAALGGGALIGGLITLTSTAAVISGARTDLDLNTELTNLGIDFAAVAVFAIVAKLDLDKQKELDLEVEEKLEKKKEQTRLVQGMKEREKELGGLRLEIQVSADGTTREALVRDLQSGARQHMIIVAGPKKACKDALVGANLLKMDFAMSNVLVVPIETDVDPAELQSRPSGGFGERPVYETQPYVARPAGEGWEDYITAEMDDAVLQNGIKTKTEGIAIVVANSGKIIRRGVGKVPWRQMVEQLQETVTGTSSDKKQKSFF